VVGQRGHGVGAACVEPRPGGDEDTALAYRLLPARRLPWRALLAGAAVAAALFEAARVLSFRALESFARYQLVYGSLAGVIVFLVWVYVAAVVFLLGAEVASWAASSTEPRRGPDGS
jgi:membrane protein